MIITVLLIIYFTTYVQQAEYKIPIQYTKVAQGAPSSSYLPLKVNPAGVIPVIFASSITAAPAAILQFLSATGHDWAWVRTAQEMLATTSPTGIAMYALLIILFTFFYTFVQINPEKAAENLQKSGAYIHGVRPGKGTEESYLIQSETCHTQTTAKLISDIVRFAQITKSNELAQLHIMGQLHELMFHLGTIAPNQKKKNISSTHQLYLECKRLIDSHYPQSLTIQDLAKELSVHRSYLSSVFKEFNTLSPKEYLLYVRMYRAKQLLENTQESIKVIAYSVGFSDPLHFSKAYKQYFNQTPSQTRKEYSQH